MGIGERIDAFRNSVNSAIDVAMQLGLSRASVIAILQTIIRNQRTKL